MKLSWHFLGLLVGGALFLDLFWELFGFGGSSEVKMENLKPCPFCGGSDLKFENDEIFCDCGVVAVAGWWNNRPLETRLKTAIDVMLKAIEFCQDMAYTKTVMRERLKNARSQAIKVLTLHKD